MMMSFRNRLALWHALIFTIILTAGGGFLVLSLREYLRAKLDASLLAMAETEIGSAFDDPRREVHLHEPLKSLRSPGVSEIDKMVQILDSSGGVVAKSGNLGEMSLPLSSDGLDQVRRGEVFFETIEDFFGDGIRVVSVPVHPGDRIRYVLQVGASLSHVRTTMRGFFGLLLVVGGVSLALTTGSGYLLARKAVDPIRRITAQARSMGTWDLSRRLEPGPVEDEIGNLIRVLNDMLSRIERGVESQKQFVAGASHEIRSPLSLLKGEIQVALRKNRTAEEYREVLRSNLEEVDRLAGLTADLLTLARIDSGRIRLRKKPIDLGEMLSREVERHRSVARSRRQEIRTGDGTPAEMEGDEDLLRLLVDNLLDNALKYSPPETVIYASAGMDHGRARIAVQDSGPGIPAADRDRIFERFFRCDRARPREPGGTGLGLSICKWIAEAHGGRISVKSREGRGSVFLVDFPVPADPGAPSGRLSRTS